MSDKPIYESEDVNEKRCNQGFKLRQREWGSFDDECLGSVCPHPIMCPLKRRKTMKLSEHFSLEELTFSQTAQRKGIDNTPSLETVAHLTTLAIGLEKVRAILGGPVRISSGYRCKALNTAIGGSKTSAHMAGYAADFVCPSFGSPLQIVMAIKDSGIQFDQCIQEGSWVHISFDPDMRGQVLTAHFSNGTATYTQGV